jgi:radical SAM protein with 4Fe4S-binding SPASM domain
MIATSKLRRQVKSLLGYFNINTFRRVFIDPCFNRCNLRCPYCPVGQDHGIRNVSHGMMSSATFRRIWEKSFRGYVGQVGLYNWGEPFLNPDLTEIVRHIKTHSRASLLLNSNFSWRLDDRLAAILSCLEDDAIVISCDGFSQETCEKYRVGVDFKLVMHNIEQICDRKKPQTRLTWQYLRFPWNLDEAKEAEDFCKSRQIHFHLGTGGISSQYPILPSPRGQQPGRSRCEFFRHALSINFDGEVYPCCVYFGPPTYSLGNASRTSIQRMFSRGRGKRMLDYLAFESSGDDGLFCKHCVERNAAVFESWK